jgi:hypothetical protein
MFAHLLLLATAPATPPAAPGPLHYRLEISATQDVDRTAIGLGRGGGGVKAVAWVAVTLQDTTGGRLAHVVIDSMSVSGSGVMEESFDPSVAKSARGAWFHLYLVDGKPQGAAAPSLANPATDLCGRALRILFSPAKAGARVGDHWSDTTTTESSSSGRTSRGSTVESWRIIAAHGDTLSAEANAIGRRSVEGDEVNGTGLATGKRTLTALRDGSVVEATAQLNEGMLMASGEGAGVVQLRSTTTIYVTRSS